MSPERSDHSPQHETPPITRVDALEARDLIDAGITVLDALPADTWRQEHLPNATSLPLQDFRPSQVDHLGRDEPLLVYCFDQHCDLSARMSRRLVELGFTAVHDLIGGRGAWTAQGLPTEGTVGDRRRISQYVSKVEGVAPGATIADVRAIDDDGMPIPVVADDGALLGALQPAARALPPETAVADVMVPAPGTIRPELRIDEVIRQFDRDGIDHAFVTAVDGTLLGIARRDALHV